MKQAVVKSLVASFIVCAVLATMFVGISAIVDSHEAEREFYRHNGIVKIRIDVAGNIADDLHYVTKTSLEEFERATIDPPNKDNTTYWLRTVGRYSASQQLIKYKTCYVQSIKITDNYEK